MRPFTYNLANAPPKALSKSPHIYERLAASLAPGIFGMEDAKKGVLALVFGGTHKVRPSAAGGLLAAGMGFDICELLDHGC